MFFRNYYNITTTSTTSNPSLNAKNNGTNNPMREIWLSIIFSFVFYIYVIYSILIFRKKKCYYKLYFTSTNWTKFSCPPI